MWAFKERLCILFYYYEGGTDIGGNRAHICPEVLGTKPGPRKVVSYDKQPVWAAGVLAYEFAGHPSPFSPATIDQCSYTVDELPLLEHTYSKNSMFSQLLPKEFADLVHGMLEIEPSSRPTLATCYGTILSLVKQQQHSASVHVTHREGLYT